MARYHGFLAMGAAALITVSAIAQTPSQQNPQAPTQRGQMMSMGDMMKGCREHCQMSMKSMDGLAKTVADAKTSNDSAKMRAALQQVEKPLADMRQHMTMCMNMMSMMEKMHGDSTNR